MCQKWGSSTWSPRNLKPTSPISVTVLPFSQLHGPKAWSHPETFYWGIIYIQWCVLTLNIQIRKLSQMLVEATSYQHKTFPSPLKFPCASCQPTSMPTSTSTRNNHWSYFSEQGLVLPRLGAYINGITQCVVFVHLAFFVQRHVFEIHPCCFLITSTSFLSLPSNTPFMKYYNGSISAVILE